MKAIVLLSGGIDSPVAAYMMGRQGIDLVLVNFDNGRYSGDGETEKVRKLMAAVEKAVGREMVKVFVPHGHVQEQLQTNCSRNMQCILCRRMMFRVAERLSARYDAQFIVTGESMGQVASQTLANMLVEERATSMAILRPLIGFDKIEIERLAKKIGTYDISILPGQCCTAAPRRPSTYSSAEQAADEESRLDMDALVDREAKEAWESQ